MRTPRCEADVRSAASAAVAPRAPIALKRSSSIAALSAAVRWYAVNASKSRAGEGISFVAMSKGLAPARPRRQVSRALRSRRTRAPWCGGCGAIGASPVERIHAEIVGNAARHSRDRGAAAVPRGRLRGGLRPRLHAARREPPARAARELERIGLRAEDDP